MANTDLDLIERERELALVTRALGAAAEGRGGATLLEGDAGAGKSALLARAADEARARGFRVLEARAGVLERTVGLGVARELVETTVVRAEADDRAALLSGAAALAAPLLGLDGDAAPRDAAAVRHGLYWLVANLAEDGPVAIVVDDLQWADEASIDWLLYVSRRLDALPVAVLAAVRLGEPDTPEHLLDALRAEPACERATLPPLTEAGVATLLGDAYDDPVDPAFVAAVHAWTGGNPHFVAEVAAELIAEEIPPVAGSTPRVRELSSRRLSSVTLMRLARLPGDATELARALAILGFEAAPRHAAALAGLDAEAAAAAIDALAAARIAGHDGAPTRVRFVHPLVGAVVYDDVAPGRRAAAHRRAAQVLHDDGAAPGAVAAQLLRAAPARDPWVVARLRAAADAVMGAGAASAAVPLLRRAREEPPPPGEVAAVEVALGVAQAAAGDPEGLDSLRRGLAASASAQERAQVALLLGRFLVIAGRGHEAAATLEPIADATPDGELRLMLEAALINAARSDTALRALADARLKAVAPAAAQDTHGGRLIAVQMAYNSVARAEPAERAVAYARTAFAGGRLIAEAPMHPDAYIVPISMLAMCDALDEATAGYEQALTHARASGSEIAYAATATMYSWTAYLAGRLGDAELLARDALRVASGTPAFAAIAGFASAHLACVLVERGDAEAALALTDVPGGAETWQRDLAFAAGRALLAVGRPDEAEARLLAAGRSSAALGIENPAFLPWRAYAALAAHAAGDAPGAARLAAEEVTRARIFGAARPLGLALRAQGLVTGETGALEESEHVLRDSPARLEHAHSLVELGAARRRAGRRGDARGPLAAGLEIAERSGATPLAQRAREELQATGARPRAHGRYDRDALTVAELRVCRLAASGASNPAIAQALFITRGTVESHLHAAYRKLGITSRAALPEALERDGA